MVVNTSFFLFLTQVCFMPHTPLAKTAIVIHNG